MKVCAIVVSFNRKELLLRCLAALDGQSLRPDRILVVDNASTDGTTKALEDAGWLARDDFDLLALEQNTGGAGGFQRGVQHAVDRGTEWLWLMDDDALPAGTALECLARQNPQSADLYGSLAMHGERLAWDLERVDAPGSQQRLTAAQELPAVCEVAFLPFLGLLFHSDIVRRIGAPDGSFFIAADDVEFCLRARRSGSRVLLVGASRIEHPRAPVRRLRFLGKQLDHLELPPWKRYYDVRNRLIVARRHHGVALFYSTVPGTVLRFLLSMALEPQRSAQACAYLGGMIDGLRCTGGKRHERWGLAPTSAHTRAAKRP